MTDAPDPGEAEPQPRGRRFSAILRFALIGILAVALAAILIRVLNPLPSLQGRSVSAAATDTHDTPLGLALASRAAAHPGLSGIHPLPDGKDAFAARVALARAATRTLDLQYYIWNRDLAGTLLFEELRAAGDRGVRVRLLLDDNVTAGLDPILAALNTHPNIEVRLFNPFVLRSPRVLGYVTDFRRLNRRMHNKSFTADNQATIVGGRNIGDEYMGAGDGLAFADLDVLAVGPAARAVSAQFDRYWASRSSYPAERILAAAGQGGLAPLADDAARIAASAAGRRYVAAIRALPLTAQIEARQLPFEWTATRLVSDDPAKGLGLAHAEDLLFPKLIEAMGRPRASLALVSGYFVPTDAGVDAFKAMAEGGAKVRILTNALEATDVPVVHAGYAPWRKAMLAAGIELYEMARAGSAGSERAGRITGKGSGAGTVIGGSATALHAKTFAIDGQRAFVGSFNFDPRSAMLNTELGLVIESPKLSQAIEQAFERTIPASAYEVKLDRNGELLWLEQSGGQTIGHDNEPGTTALQRTVIGFLSLLRIDWLL